MTTESPQLVDIADELYALPLSEFTPARDARVKEFKGTDLAAQVKALKKPALAAWVVNLLVRRAAEQVEQVLAVGAALREAQEGMSAPELRELTKQRRQLTAAVTGQARALAAEEGVRITEAVADQVEATLTAAMVSERCGEAVRSGLLVAALTTTGMDDVDPTPAVAVPEALGFAATPTEAEPPPRPDLRVVPDPDAHLKALAAAREALAEADDQMNFTRAGVLEAQGIIDYLAARQLEIESEIDELRRRIAGLEQSYDEVDDELGEAHERLRDAQEECDAAVARQRAAAAEVARLS